MRLGPEAAPPAEPRKKSKAVAVILALIFGPLGLLYLGMEGLVAVLFVFGIGLFILPFLIGGIHHVGGLGWLVSAVARLACAWWAMNAVDSRNARPDAPDVGGLLDEAARLENVDFAQAIAKYEELIEKYPESTASGVARNCLRTLRSHQPPVQAE